MKYRIVKFPTYYLIQYKGKWWWPDWKTDSKTFMTQEAAMAKINEYKKLDINNKIVPSIVYED
jgi:hypothetical protein